VKLRVSAATAAVLFIGALSAPAAYAAASTTIVISQVQVRGPAGGNDEMIVLKNKSTWEREAGALAEREAVAIELRAADSVDDLAGSVADLDPTRVADPGAVRSGCPGARLCFA